MGDNMLKKFTVENYRSFCAPVTIDFTCTRDYQYNTTCVKDGLLSKMIVFGKNASGKSNLGLALFDIVNVLTDKSDHMLMQRKRSFQNADCDADTATFTYVLQRDKDTIHFSYQKTSPNTLVYEELRINDQLVFTYDFRTQQNNLHGLEKIDASTLNFDLFDGDISVLKYIASNTTQPENSLVRFVMNFVSRMLWFRSLESNDYIGFTTGAEDLPQWIVENDYTAEFQRFLHEFAGLDMKLDALKGVDDKALLVEVHKNRKLVFLETMSNGTAALMLLFYWHKSFDDVSFLFMDEFDAFYHFELAYKIIKYVVSLDNVQAVFTTHNTFLASNNLLRPDCYFMLEAGKLISFADSTQRELREGHNLEKMLRNGEFNG